jgi:hypothetical protein
VGRVREMGNWEMGNWEVGNVLGEVTLPGMLKLRI